MQYIFKLKSYCLFKKLLYIRYLRVDTVELELHRHEGILSQALMLGNHMYDLHHTSYFLLIANL